jgi:lysophospholipase L1-like esterase
MRVCKPVAMEPLDGSVATIRAPKPGRRTILVGLGLVVAVAALGVGIRGRLAATSDAELKTTDCKNVRGITSALVKWRRKPDGSAFAVEEVRAPNWSKSLDGWRLHYRPAGASGDYFASDVHVRDGEITETWLETKSILSVPLYFPLGEMVITSLTCPGGECLFSPLSGCKATYDYDRTGAKVAITGDSLTTFDEVCGIENRPVKPDFCSTPLGDRLRLRGMRVFTQANSGQGFHSWLPVVREMATTEPNTYVLALGTNDALRRQAKTSAEGRPRRRAETEQAIRQSLREIREISPKTCIVLVTASGKGMNHHQSHPDYVAEAEIVNKLLRDAAAKPNEKIQIADFDKAAREHCGPDWLTAEGKLCDWFQVDQLHLRGLGNEARNELILAAIDRCQGTKR